MLIFVFEMTFKLSSTNDHGSHFSESVETYLCDYDV